MTCPFAQISKSHPSQVLVENKPKPFGDVFEYMDKRNNRMTNGAVQSKYERVLSYLNIISGIEGVLALEQALKFGLLWLPYDKKHIHENWKILTVVRRCWGLLPEPKNIPDELCRNIDTLLEKKEYSFVIPAGTELSQKNRETVGTLLRICKSSLDDCRPILFANLDLRYKTPREEIEKEHPIVNESLFAEYLSYFIRKWEFWNCETEILIFKERIKILEWILNLYERFEDGTTEEVTFVYKMPDLVFQTEGVADLLNSLAKLTVE